MIEDEPPHAAWLQTCIQQVGGLSPVQHIEDVETAQLVLQQWRDQPPALVLLDLRLHGKSSLNLLAQLRKQWPKTPVLVVSAFSDEAHCLEAIRRGASGFVVKDGETSTLAQAIDSVLKGLFLLSPGVARHMLAAASAAMQASPGPTSTDPQTESAVHETEEPAAIKLSSRERAVLDCLAQGLSYDEAALSLNVSRSTVQSHVRNIYRKLQVRSKVAALLRARLWGLLGKTAGADA